MRKNKSDQSPRRAQGRTGQKDTTPPRSVDDIRLNKYLAECGVSSRRGAEELIAEGAVQVNGKKVYELGARVNIKTDRVTLYGKPVRMETRKVYILFNKPKGVMTTMDDPEGRTSIADYLKRLEIRVFPVGRLDYDSEGLLLLTNDGDFAQKVTHPKHEVLKTYLVKVSGQPSEEQIRKLRMGVSIVGGRVAAREIEKLRGTDSEKYDWYKMVIGEGKNRQIRQMFEKIGFDVMKLQRVAIGKLKMGSLERGEWVFLNPEDLEKIFHRDAERAGLGGRAIARKSGKHAPKTKSLKAQARDESSRRLAQKTNSNPHPRLLHKSARTARTARSASSTGRRRTP